MYLMIAELHHIEYCKQKFEISLVCCTSPLGRNKCLTYGEYHIKYKYSLKIPKGGNQDPYIEDEQTSQWPKQKGQTTIYKTYI
jgi:hypothetical protein